MESIYHTQLYSSAPPTYGVPPQPTASQTDHHLHHYQHSPYGYRSHPASDLRSYHPDTYSTPSMTSATASTTTVSSVHSVGWPMPSHMGWNSSPPLPASRSFANPTKPDCFAPASPPGGDIASASMMQASAAASNTTIPTASGPRHHPTAPSAAPNGIQRPKLTTTLWEDEGTLCYQVDAKSVCVARRQDNDMINGTKLLNVVGMSRGKRDGILKNEKGRVVVKVGAMHLKGVWITFQRAKDLAAKFSITDILYPLFVDSPAEFVVASNTPSSNASSVAASIQTPSSVTSGSCAVSGPQAASCLNQYPYRDYGAMMQSWDRPAYHTLPSITCQSQLSSSISSSSQHDPSTGQLVFRSHPSSANDTSCSPIPGSVATVFSTTSPADDNMYLLNHSYDYRTSVTPRGYSTTGPYATDSGVYNMDSAGAPNEERDHPLDHMTRKSTLGDVTEDKNVDLPHSPPPDTSLHGRPQLVKYGYSPCAFTQQTAPQQNPPTFANGNSAASWSAFTSPHAETQGAWPELHATRKDSPTAGTTGSIVSHANLVNGSVRDLWKNDVNPKKRGHASIHGPGAGNDNKGPMGEEDEDEDEGDDGDDEKDEDYCEENYKANSSRQRKRVKSDK